ncbi:hypothetical protein JCM10213_008520 [Rhodosporidiobolus nylandii]
MSRPPIPPSSHLPYASSAPFFPPASAFDRPGPMFHSSDESTSTLSSTASGGTASSEYSSDASYGGGGGGGGAKEHPYAEMRGADEFAGGPGEEALQRSLARLSLAQQQQQQHVPSFTIPYSSPPHLPSSPARPSLSAIVTTATSSRGLSAPSPVDSPASFGSASPVVAHVSSAHRTRISPPAAVAAPGMVSSASLPSASLPRSHRFASPPHSARPSSSGTTATASTAGSSRPWVFDSDASSVCSGHSAQSAPLPSAAAREAERKREAEERERRVMVNADGSEEVVDEGGEVFKAVGDMEFLDHRPEPPGASLSIDRTSSASLVIVRVTLPGFSLENITVAMRRHHRVHIVADSYGPDGGHFEKLVSLGSDVSSAAPRAEFDGTTLRIYVQRRPSRPSSAASTASSVAPAPFGWGTLPPVPTGVASPTSSVYGSPDLALDHARRPSIASSLASVHSDFSSTSSPAAGQYPTLSPSLDSAHYALAAFAAAAPIELSEEDLPPPCTARAPPSPTTSAASASRHKKSLTGPEGARAAAKAAKEELARRAEEEARRLPREARGGRWCPFREARAAEAGGGPCSSSSSSSPNSASGSASGSAYATSASESEASPPLQSEGMTSPGLGKVAGMAGMAEMGAFGATGVERSGTIKAPSPSSASRSPSPLPSSFSNAAPLPERPKLRGNNLTLRPFPASSPSTATFGDLSRQHSEGSSSGSTATLTGGGSDGGTTPRWEVDGMRFTSTQ